MRVYILNLIRYVMYYYIINNNYNIKALIKIVARYLQEVY